MVLNATTRESLLQEVPVNIYALKFDLNVVDKINCTTFCFYTSFLFVRRLLC